MAEFLRGRYVSAEFLGQGAMGRVWLAHPRGEPGRNVVVKVMHRHVAAQPGVRSTFDREAQSMARLRHPYIVRLLEASFTDPEGPCLVMEHAPGVTLEKYLDVTKRLTVGHAGLILGCICHALDAAHTLGVVHRDLKPANLMIVGAGTPDETVRVMDFGLAHFCDKPYFTIERLNGAQQVAAQGTPAYLCPEQLRGDEIDARSDLYSVGVVLYEMLAGQLPFPYDEVPRVLRAHLHEKPIPFALAGVRDVPPAVEKVVMHCLSKFGVERPGSARNLADRFSEALDIDIWEATRPEGEAGAGAADPADDPDAARYAIVQKLEAWMPERIAVVKLRGFLEDKGGRVVESEPGLLRMRLGEPKNQDPSRKKTIAQAVPDRLPVEIEMRMAKPDPNANVLRVTIFFRPFTDPFLLQVPDWRKRCDLLYRDLQSYLMAR